MAGIYIHIPFCKKACHYCNFHFSTSANYQNEMIDSILQELFIQKDFFENEKIETIYFGGGTPSFIETYQIERILNQIQNYFSLQDSLEITLEANPDDLKKEKIQSLKKIGINRLSIGVQSFFDEDLIYMNRSHHAKQAIQSIEDIITAGFTNYSIDFIYGFPLLSDEKWQKNIDLLTHYQVPHLSCYAMTVEAKTALNYLIEKKKIPPMNESQSADQFIFLMDRLAEKGYHHYEISNFSRKGYEAIHNSNYWKSKKYLGIGPSAHSYNGKQRFWNISNNAKYISSLSKNLLNQEEETLTHKDIANETIMISLRTSKGISKKIIEELLKNRELEIFQTKIKNYIKSNLIFEQNEFYILTQQGKLFADRIAMDLFIDTEYL
ncbi:MAG TPA: radical SAM family heme chaperone HemW [Chitinophagaceae bacterium]|nr:radical SAM family heme chaperone HemW [Chitinophagaceae bacterium]